MRLFRALCIVLGALLSVATLPLGSYAADALTLSEAFVLTKDGQLVDTLTITDTSGVMTDSVCTPYEGNSTDHRVEFVVRNGVSICHMQLMYTRAEDESEFTINDTGEYVLTARTDHTLTEYRKTFGDSLTTTSVSLSVEGDVLSSTAGAASSAMAYENRSFTVVTWDRSVPDVITVRGTLAAGGDRSSAGSSHALKNPWGATPLPGTNGDTSTQNPDTAASAGPSLGLLIGLIVSLIVVVLVAVFTVYAVRAKKSEEKAKPKDEAQAELSAEPRAEPSVEPGGGPNAKATSKDAEHPSSSPSMEGAASLVHARPSPLLWRTDYEPYCTPPSHSEDPMSNESGCHSRPHVPTEDSRRIEIEDPLQPNAPSPESRRNGIEPPSFPTPPASTNQGGSSADGSRFSAPGTDAPTAHLTPRETGFVWVPRSRPASSQPTPDAVPQPMKQPRRKRSRGGHRPAVFPERPVQGTTQAPNAVAPGQMRPTEGTPLRPPQGMPMQPPQGMQVRPLGAPAGSTRRSGSVTPPQPNAPWGPPSANQIRAAFPPPGGTHASSRPFDVLPHASSENSFDSPQATFSAPRQEQIVVSRTEIVSASEPAAHGFPDSETIPFPGSEALNVPGPEPVVVSDAIPLPPHEPTASAAPEADPEPYAVPQPAPEPDPVPNTEPSAPTNLEDATKAIDVSAMTNGEIIPSASTQWNYWTAMAAPATDWATTASLADWSRGAGPIGWGDSDAVTRLDIAKKDRPVTYYFARDIDLGTITPNTSLTFKVRADDGVVLRINGQVVDTKRMSPGNISHDTYANAAVTAPQAASDLLEVKIPASYLTSGVNRIGVEEHINYKGTPSMSFDLSATMAK